MNYYRKTVNNTANEIKLEIQIGALTVKINENINKINDLLEVDKNIKNNISSNLTKIGDNETNISSNATKIGDNETNISSNLTKIDDNETNISSNATKIGDNETNISSNLTKIDENETNISSNATKIGDNETNISSNLTKIDDNETNISSNATKIGDNETNISSNLTKIGDNETNISLNLEKINSIKQNNLKISNNVFNDKYDIEKQLFSFNKNVHSYKLFEKVFEYDFNTDGELIINTIINYKYDNLKNDINRLTHLYEFFDDKNVLFYSITLDNHDFGIPSNSDKNISNIDNNFCFNINNMNNIKLVLSLTRINQWGNGNIKLKMIDDNYINIAYKVKTDISNKFDENDKKIKILDEKVSVNNTLMGNNFNSLLPLKSNYITNNIWLFNLDNKDINLIYNIQKFVVYENKIIYNFKIGSFIELNESCLYLLDSLKNFYFILKKLINF